MKNLYLSTFIIIVFFKFSFAQTNYKTIQTVKKNENSLNHEFLKTYFNDFSVYQINSSEIKSLFLGQNNSATINVALDENYTFFLEKNNLYSEKYKSIKGTTNGNFEQNIKPQNTYKGYVNNDPTQKIRLTIDEGFIFGFFTKGSEEFYIEPIYRFDKNAAFDTYIIYNSKHAKNTENTSCGVIDVKRKTQNISTEIQKRDASTRCNFIVEIAIAADFSMYTKNGSSEVNTNNYTAGVINAITANYDNEFHDEISFSILTQFVSTSSVTTLESAITATTNSSIVLDNFVTWGNGSGFGTTSYDIAEFWTNRDFTGSTVGLAYVGSICSSNRYHILQDFSTNAQQIRVMTAHEIGHNFNCVHDAVGSPHIMAPSVSTSTSWSPESQNILNSFYLTLDCLAPENTGISFLASKLLNEFPSTNTIDGACLVPVSYIDYTIPVTLFRNSLTPIVSSTVAVGVASTADTGKDFQLLTTTLTFPAGNTNNTQNITIRVFNDFLAEVDEIVALELSSTELLCKNDVQSFTIKDDDDINLSLIQTSVGFGEHIFQYPFIAGYTDGRYQSLYTKEHLVSKGFKKGFIESLTLYVDKNSSNSLADFSIKLKNTSSTNLSEGFEGSTTTFFTGAYTFVDNANVFVGQAPFLWDGQSNLILEICFDDIVPFDNNDFIVTSTSSSNANRIGTATTGSGCTLPSTFFTAEALDFDASISPYLQSSNQLNTTVVQEINLGEKAIFRDQNFDLLCAIEATAQNFGCVEVTLDGIGSGNTIPTWLNYPISNRTFKIISPLNDDYNATFYYNSTDFSGDLAASVSTNAILKTPLEIINTENQDGVIKATPTYNSFTINSSTTHSFEASFNTFSGFAMTPSSTVLPIHFLHFFVTSHNDDAHLSWAINNEKELMLCVVERSMDGILFENISTLSDIKSNKFEYSDQKIIDLKSEIIYYRIKFLDKDQNVFYSPIRSLSITHNDLNPNVYPNPFDKNINISGFSPNEAFTYQIFGSFGKIVQSGKSIFDIYGSTSLMLNTLQPATYFLKIRQNNADFLFKIIKK